jgi:hypothetical protein
LSMGGWGGMGRRRVGAGVCRYGCKVTPEVRAKVKADLEQRVGHKVNLNPQYIHSSRQQGTCTRGTRTPR